MIQDPGLLENQVTAYGCVYCKQREQNNCKATNFLFNGKKKASLTLHTRSVSLNSGSQQSSKSMICSHLDTAFTDVKPQKTNISTVVG